MSPSLTRSLRALAVLLALIGPGLCALSRPALAQELRATRDAAFARMYAAPTDRAAMIAYARASIALRDYEAATAVLERLVTLEPGNLEARTQLALAYFALGADAMAERHLGLVAAADPARAADLAAYRKAAARRLAPSRLDAQVWIGTLSSSTPGRNFAEAGLTLTHRADLGGAAGTEWVTRLALSLSAAPEDPAAAGGHRADLRSGPVLRLGGASGPVVNPYALAAIRRDAEGGTERRLGLGLLAQVPLGQALLTGDVATGTLDDGTAHPGRFHRADLGLTLPLPQDSLLRLRLGRTDQQGGTLRTEQGRTLGLDLGTTLRPVLWDAERPLDLLLSVSRDGLLRDGAPRRDRQIHTASLRAPLGGGNGSGWFEIAAGRALSDRKDDRNEWVQLRMGWDF